VIRIDPGQWVEREVRLVDPQPVFDRIHPPHSIPLQGSFRASVRYFRSEEEWLALMKKPSRVQYRTAFSDTFEMPKTRQLLVDHEGMIGEKSRGC
jgi:hypothetical protein